MVRDKALGTLKSVLRRVPGVYPLWSRFRDRIIRDAAMPPVERGYSEQDLKYLALCEDAARRLPDFFAPPGHEARSKELLLKGWTRKTPARHSPKEVRLFVIDRPCVLGPWFEEEFARSFDVTVFNTQRHLRRYAEGDRNLASAAVGLDPRDRLAAPVHHQKAADYAGWRRCVQADILTALRKALEAGPIDFCFAYGSFMEFEPETFQAIRRMGVPVGLWWLDEKHAFWSWPSEPVPTGQEPLIGACDVHLTNSFDCLRWYAARGASAYYLPQAIDMAIFKPSGVARDIPVSFIGGAYGHRGEFIRKLRRTGLPVTCFGEGWEKPPARDAIEIYCRSRINLGMGYTGHSSLLSCIKGRDIEVPATGSLYLTSFDPELARLFDVGKEMLCYRNEMDCADQIRYFLERPEEAAQIGAAGLARCRASHTWTRRMTALLEWMGIMR